MNFFDTLGQNIGSFVTNPLQTGAMTLSQLGYQAGLPGLGISRPVGSPSVNPVGVYAQNLYGGTPNVPITRTPPGIALGSNSYPAGGTPTVSTPTGGNTVGGNPNPAPAAEDPYAQLRGDINQKWDSYFPYLDQMANSLGAERTANEGIVSNTYRQGLSDLNLSNQEALNTIGTQRRQVGERQVKSLKDITANLQNQYEAANNFLGAMGAGDSSAKNMYSYALAKVGTQQRGDVMSQTSSIMNDIDAREVSVKRTYQNELQRLDTNKQNQLYQLASQFEQGFRSLSEARANGRLQRDTDIQNLSTQLYSAGMSRLQAIDTDYRNYRSRLDTWALNNSNSVAQAKQNLQAIQNVAYTPQQYRQMNTMPQFGGSGNMFAPTGYGNSNEKYDQFGRRIA